MESESRISRTFRCLAIVGGLALVALGLGTAVAAASGPFSGPNGKIAVDKSGKGPMRMGVLSHNGKFRSLYEASSDDFINAVSFSPDGSRIAFTYGFQPTSLAIANLATGKSRPVRLGDYNVYNPTWVKGGRIIFSGQLGSHGKRPGTYAVGPDGLRLHRLFKRQVIATSPNRGNFVASNRSGNSHHLDLLSRKGKKVRTLASDKKFFFNDATFSPNGRWIVYQRGPANPRGDYRGNLFMVRKDGTHRRKLTSGNRDRDPAFSPDGRWVAYDRTRHGHSYASNIWATSVKNPGKRRQITHSGKRTTYFDVSWGRR